MEDGARRASILRDNARHDTLIISKEEDAQGHEYTGKVTTNRIKRLVSHGKECLF